MRFETSISDLGPPTFVPCPFCSRKFSERSLRIHEPQCLKRLKAAEEARNAKKNSKTRRQRTRTKTHSQPLRRQVSTGFEITSLVSQGGDTITSLPITKQKLRKSSSTETYIADLLERPQTKTLNYPTPNIVHPVITNKSGESRGHPKHSDKISHKSVVIQQPMASPRESLKVEEKQPTVKLGKLKEESSLTSTCCGLNVSDDKEAAISLSQCQSCERSNRPEKLHSHKNSVNIAENIESSTLVQATGFHSKSKTPFKIYRQASNSNNIRRAGSRLDRAILVDSKGSVGYQLRFNTCHLCGKNCASKSFQVHLRRCEERWEIENRPLPALKSKTMFNNKLNNNNNNNVNASSMAFEIAPEKPIRTTPWEAFQDQLEACPHCARTFLPERLKSHVRSCRNIKKDTPPPPSQVARTFEKAPEKKTTNKVLRRPPMVLCYICGRQFGTQSISLHEPQCLKKWNMENDRLPKHMRRPEPQKPDTILSARASTAQSSSPSLRPQSTSNTRQIATLKNRQLSTPTGTIKSSMETGTLPKLQPPPQHKPESQMQLATAHEISHQRSSTQSGKNTPSTSGRQRQIVPSGSQQRQIVPSGSQHNQITPTSSQYVFESPLFRTFPRGSFPEARDCWLFYLRQDGTIDLDAMAEAAWQSHLEQLVPCNGCGRTFLPDRLIVHQRSCQRK